MNISDKRLLYITDDEPQRLHRTHYLPSATLMINISPKDHYKHWYWIINGFYSESDVPLLEFVSRPTDGLIHYTGSQDIRNQRNWGGGLYAFYRDRNIRNHTVKVHYRKSYNVMSLSSVFNTKTGETFLIPTYGDGNYTLTMNYNFVSFLGKNSPWYVSTTTDFYAKRSENFSRTLQAESEDDMSRFYLYVYTVKENFRLQWSKNSIIINAVFNGDYTRYDMTEPGVKSTDLWSLNYGVTSSLKLPQNWSIGTDFTLYTRRGFRDTSLNTTEAVWNARISKSLLRGSLVFIADGYDILRQIKSVSYRVSATQRTETSYNSVPSYFLVHLQYRFHKQPKR